jgi:hypothetical protein
MHHDDVQRRCLHHFVQALAAPAGPEIHGPHHAGHAVELQKAASGAGRNEQDPEAVEGQIAPRLAMPSTGRRRTARGLAAPSGLRTAAKRGPAPSLWSGQFSGAGARALRVGRERAYASGPYQSAAFEGAAPIDRNAGPNRLHRARAAARARSRPDFHLSGRGSATSAIGANPLPRPWRKGTGRSRAPEPAGSWACRARGRATQSASAVGGNVTRGVLAECRFPVRGANRHKRLDWPRT